jgi:hypothetical protein
MSAKPTNKSRAARCARVLGRYGTDDTAKGCLVDFLADARHWCDRHGEDFAGLDRQAYQHYLAELHEEKITP